MTNGNNLAEKHFWDNIYGQSSILSYDPSKILFVDLFKKYVKPGSSCFEVGCYPGKYLIHLSREFGCRVSGLDFTSQFSVMENFLKKEGALVDELYCQDFFDFVPRRTYDFVFSLGFVEHFGDYRAVIAKHIELVGPGGVLMITCPNFRGIQWLLHYLLDRPNLMLHNINAMDLHAWRTLLLSRNMTILQHQPYETFRFWSDQVPPDRIRRWLTKKLKALSQSTAIQRIDWPTKWTSPYLVSVSRKDVS